MITRQECLPYVSACVDDTGAMRTLAERPALPLVRFVGYQCGFEPLIVAVWSYLPGCTVDDEEAESLARDYLQERGWFGDEEPEAATFIV